MRETEGVREDLVDGETIASFVGEVEPGDHVALRIVLWSVGLSVVFIVAASIWWSVSH